MICVKTNVVTRWAGGTKHTARPIAYMYATLSIYIMYINEEVSKGWMDNLMQAGVVGAIKTKLSMP